MTKKFFYREKLFIFIFLLLIFSRFAGLDWGLPYPMHPDERNIAQSIVQLRCDFSLSELIYNNKLKECFNPNFFAYGQFPLYISYFLIFLSRFLVGDFETRISFSEAVLSLRLISASVSVMSFFLILKILKFIKEKKFGLIEIFISSFLIIFSPFFIQYSRFGTTESLLMFFYLLIIYLSLIFFRGRLNNFYFVLFSGFISGLSLATKVSSVFFLIFIALVIFIKQKNSFFSRLYDIFKYSFFSFLFFLIFSPHNFLNFENFLHSLAYESDVGLGRYIVFYTQQFEYSIPIVFQIFKIIPFALGPLSVISMIKIFYFARYAFLFNLSKLKKIKNELILLMAFLIYFIPNSFIFSKWTRFIAPIFPILLIFGILFLIDLKIKNFFKLSAGFFLIIPGILYLSIYLRPDIRFKASEWIYANVPDNAYILSEAGNVIDIPVVTRNIIDKVYQNKKNFNLISFDFYNVDRNKLLQEEFEKHLEKADFIIIGSRRVFANYTCYWPGRRENFLDKISYQPERCKELRNKFPLLNDYYQDLFEEKLNFKLIKKFSAFDFGFFNFDDEIAEETVSVFDHPVIRIYKRI